MNIWVTGRIFIKYILDKRLISKVHKEFLNVRVRKQPYLKMDLVSESLIKECGGGGLSMSDSLRTHGL